MGQITWKQSNRRTQDQWLHWRLAYKRWKYTSMDVKSFVMGLILERIGLTLLLDGLVLSLVMHSSQLGIVHWNFNKDSREIWLQWSDVVPFQVKGIQQQSPQMDCVNFSLQISHYRLHSGFWGKPGPAESNVPIHAN